MSYQAASSPPNHEPAVQSFIRSGWLSLGAIAWLHFQKDGRGAIYIRWDEALVIDPENWKAVADVQYLSVKDAELLALCLEMNASDVVVVIETYNPEKEVLFFVRMPDGSLLDYLVAFQDLPTPVECFDVMAKLTPCSGEVSNN
ncbi:MAG: hypothetical protein HY231_13860 [Acidobacteria bacterium]|nr:hypothetical protein [Acidobacteriota bacterium]